MLNAGRELDRALAELDARAADSAPANDNAERALRGDLRWKLQPHQERTYDAYKEWDAYRQTPEYAAMVERVGAQYDSLFLNYAGRRVGKTSETIIIFHEKAIDLPLRIGRCSNGAVLMYFTAFQNNIGEIIVPLAIELMKDCPREIRPEYAGRRGAIGPSLFFENGSYIKLVGVDKNPDGLRGRYSDSIAGSEASFIKTSATGRGLKYTIQSVLLPQFQGRPWASLILETSAPKDPEHIVLTKIRPDAEMRGAFVERTLDDNTSLSDIEKQREIRQAGGRGDPDCEREFFNVVSRDPDEYVVPEFSAKDSVQDVERPEQALCYVIADPGFEDLFALLFGYIDFERDRVVLERSWARKNAGTRQAAVVIAYYEWLLWGREPPSLMDSLPLERTNGRDGWIELLKGTDATREQCEQLYELSRKRDEERAPLYWPLQPDAGHFTYWHRNEERTTQNPYARYSDVDLRLVADLDTEFGLAFNATAKDDRDAQIKSFRNACAAGKVICLPDSGPVAKHIENATWAETTSGRRTDWARHATYGHFDLLACAIYFWRNADLRLNPAIPPARLASTSGQFVDLRWAAEQERDELADGLFGDGGRRGRGPLRLSRGRRVGGIF